MDSLISSMSDSNKNVSIARKNKRIIYAPHHSLEKKHHNKYATFQWNGRWLLSYAKMHPDMDWVFKPHPRLKHALLENELMTHDEVDGYYAEWESLSNAVVLDEGDYLEIFRDSDALVTDCGSFLLEYYFTRRPIIQLVNDASAGYGEFGEKVIEYYYKARDTKELEMLLSDVVIGGNDYLKSARLSTLDFPDDQAGERIKEYLKNELS
ncbi:hypothetical protein BWR19_08410 [Halomonas sp. 1513]|nr:hypothetical protein BWR19_08410 [Halomonas sp. 1513]